VHFANFLYHVKRILQGSKGFPLALSSHQPPASIYPGYARITCLTQKPLNAFYSRELKFVIGTQFSSHHPDLGRVSGSDPSDYVRNERGNWAFAW
jgi:hypothetical protein